jgi:hypothetical protein
VKPLNMPGRSGKWTLYNGRRKPVAARRHLNRMRRHGSRPWMQGLPLPMKGSKK